MSAHAQAVAADDLPRRQGFVRSALRRAGWRMFLLLQALGLLYAFIMWCELTQGGAPQRLLLPLSVLRSLSALLVFVAALAADESVRRGWPIWRAFLVAFAALAVGVTLLEWCSGVMLGYRDRGPPGVIGYGVYESLYVAEGWALVVLVFLDRQSAARKMAAVHNTELERLELERRVTGSRMAAASARLDPLAVRAQLGEIRDLYSAALPGAEEKLAALIRDLEDSVRRGTGTTGGGR